MSPAETEVLRQVWQLNEATVQQICDQLPSERDIGYNSVHTLLCRLERKGYLKHRERGKAHVFYPVVKQKEVVRRTVADFLDRLFGGDPRPLVQSLVEDGKITEDDIKRLRKLIKKK
jgi:predicted transcriptional regulator